MHGGSSRGRGGRRAAALATLALLAAACTVGHKSRGAGTGGRAAGCAAPAAPARGWSELPAPAAAQGRRAQVDALLAGGPGRAPQATGSTVGPDGTRAVAAWALAGGRWRPLALHHVTLDGPHDRLLSVAGRGRVAVGLGVAFSPLHGNQRPSAWRRVGDGPWREVRAERELFDGPATIAVRRVAAGPRGVVVVGARVGADNRAFAAVWRSPDGAAWARPREEPALTSGPREQLAAGGAAVGRAGVVVVGTATRLGVPGDPADAAIWFGPGQGGFRRVPAGPAGLGGPGWQQADLVVAGGAGFVTVGTSGTGGSAWPVAWTSADGLAWRRAPGGGFPGPGGAGGGSAGGAAGPGGAGSGPAGPGMGGGRVTDLAAAAGGLLAAGLVGGAPCLWTSADGARWTVTPLPERLRGRRATTALVAGDGAGGALLAVQGGDSPALWRWARPPASRRSAPRPG